MNDLINNSARILEIARREIPVYPGCLEAMIRPPPEEDFHGKDGLGDSEYYQQMEGYTQCIKADKHASMVMLDLSREHGKISILALGPLTNIALALKLDPTFSDRISRIIVMSGSYAGRGNIKSSTEFNLQ